MSKEPAGDYVKPQTDATDFGKTMPAELTTSASCLADEIKTKKSAATAKISFEYDENKQHNYQRTPLQPTVIIRKNTEQPEFSSDEDVSKFFNYNYRRMFHQNEKINRWKKSENLESLKHSTIKNMSQGPVKTKVDNKNGHEEQTISSPKNYSEDHVPLADKNVKKLTTNKVTEVLETTAVFIPDKPELLDFGDYIITVKSHQKKPKRNIKKFRHQLTKIEPARNITKHKRGDANESGSGQVEAQPNLKTHSGKQ